MLAVVCLVGLPSHAFAVDEKQDAAAPLAYAIGDSVLLGASSDLVSLGMRVDAVEGRRPTRLMDALRHVPDDGRPIVVHLGTNGPFTKELCERFRDAVVGSRPVVLITIRAPRAWVPTTNQEIRKCAHDIATATLLPWHRIANERPEALYPDGIHLTPAGTALIVQEITQALARAKSAM